VQVAIDKNADLVVVNGDIRTMDPLVPRVSAVAIRDGRVTALGSDEDIRPLAAHAARIIDAQGRLVLPGFQDTHIHLQDSGTDRALFVDLEGATTIEELQKRLRDSASRRNGGWIKGVGWYSGIFGERNLARFSMRSRPTGPSSSMHRMDTARPSTPRPARSSE
jgi:predicted amidohydrolase YtcJ